jgi:hypothetical protein
MLNTAAWLITQRSQVQILPPLPGSAGLDRLYAPRPWNLALDCGM